MKRKLTMFLSGMLLMFILSACSGNNDSNTGNNVPDTNTGGGEVANAESLYKQSCISCHGDQLQGNGAAPSLQAVGGKLSKEEIVKVVKNGQGGMPAFGNRLDTKEIEALAEWLAAKK